MLERKESVLQRERERERERETEFANERRMSAAVM